MIKRISMPTSDDTILRCLKQQVKARDSEGKTRVVGLGDWVLREGSTYGSTHPGLGAKGGGRFFLEPAAGMTADWFKRHSDVEIISRDRCGSIAQVA